MRVSTSSAASAASFMCASRPSAEETGDIDSARPSSSRAETRLDEHGRQRLDLIVSSPAKPAGPIALYTLLGCRPATQRRHTTPVRPPSPGEIEDSNKRDLMYSHRDAKKLGVRCAAGPENLRVHGQAADLFGLCASRAWARREISAGCRRGGPFRTSSISAGIITSGTRRHRNSSGRPRQNSRPIAPTRSLGRAMESAGQTQEDKRHGGGNLFETFGEAGTEAAPPSTACDIPPWPTAEQLKYEKAKPISISGLARPVPGRSTASPRPR